MSLIVLIAGGTGGHLFPAMALAQELTRRGHTIHLMTDHRVASYGAQFPAAETHIVPSATPSVRDPIKLARASVSILRGIGVARSILRQVRPNAVVGFGGYPVFPPFVAARMQGIPGILHEQNAIMGRANRALASRATGIALSFARTARAEAFAGKSMVTGNPVRDNVRAAADVPYPPLDATDPIELVVFAGSQGARAFSDFLPPAIALLPEALRSRLRISQQVRAEDHRRVSDAYRLAGVAAELQPFFVDLPQRLAKAHLVVSRSGASTVADLTVLGRPAIYVPLPGSIDADQRKNAEVVDAAGGGWIVEQATISPPSLANRLTSLLGDPATLRAAAAAAKSLGQPLAVERLADLVEAAARGKTT
jgi:UDP-N-acetylglucosamine--N-acetylmuramyl-(pentapeptide) pyrophosphoryl-undecaprenol N-acetylglucosamine transferase